MRTIPAFPSLFSFLALARLTHSLENLGGENLKFIMISSLCSHHQCGISIQITFYYAPELYCLAFSHSHTLTHEHDSSTHSFLKKVLLLVRGSNLSKHGECSRHLSSGNLLQSATYTYLPGRKPYLSNMRAKT